MVTHLSLESINDELESMGLHTLNALLYYMIPILILHALQHVAIQLSYHITLHHTVRNVNHLIHLDSSELTN